MAGWLVRFIVMRRRRRQAYIRQVSNRYTKREPV